MKKNYKLSPAMRSALLNATIKPYGHRLSRGVPTGTVVALIKRGMVRPSKDSVHYLTEKGVQTRLSLTLSGDVWGDA